MSVEKYDEVWAGQIAEAFTVAVVEATTAPMAGCGIALRRRVGIQVNVDYAKGIRPMNAFEVVVHNHWAHVCTTQRDVIDYSVLVGGDEVAVTLVTAHDKVRYAAAVVGGFGENAVRSAFMRSFNKAKAKLDRQSRRVAVPSAGAFHKRGAI